MKTLEFKITGPSNRACAIAYPRKHIAWTEVDWSLLRKRKWHGAMTVRWRWLYEKPTTPRHRAP